MTKKTSAVLVLLGILFISFNLRAPITAVGSISEMIQQEFQLSTAATGFITTLPLLSFAVVSPFVSTISGKLGQAWTMLLGLLLILGGELVRSYTGAAGLFVGTAIIGVGIAIGNVIIPSVIKLRFADRVGAVTSVYTSGMCIFAAVGAGVSVPLAKGIELGWKHTLAVWVILAVVTLVIWFPQVREKTAAVQKVASERKSSSIWSSKLAWWVTLYMGIQSLLFYSLVAWLPTIILSKNFTEAFAGNMAMLFQLMAIPATLIIPTLCDKLKTQSGLVYAVCLIYASGMLLFLMGHTAVMITLAVILMSIGMGGSISLSIAFISLRSPNAQRAAQLSGMSQSAGYLLAALGPVLTGGLFDHLHTWSVPVCMFLLLIVALALCGTFAGANVTVRE